MNISTYNKHTWYNGEIITAENLNRLEDAIDLLYGRGVMNIFTQTTEPDSLLGLWISDTKATGQTYLLDTLSVNTDGVLWESQTAIPYVLHDHGAGVIGDNLYLVGGIKNSTSTTLSDSTTDCIKFNLSNQTWSTCASMPAKKNRPSVCVHNGKLYVLHCMDCGESDNKHLNWYCYTPETDSWELEYTWSEATTCFNPDACVVVGDYIYILGGNDNVGASQSHIPSKHCYKYNVLTKELTQIADMSIGHGAGSAAVVGNKIYISGGGYYNTRSDYGTTQVLECYDTITGTWETLENQPVKRSLGRCVSAAGKIWFTCGGVTPYVYDVLTDTWETFARVRPDSTSDLAENGASLVAYNNDLWFSGGHSGKTGVNPDGGQYRYRIDALSQYEDGDVLAVSLPYKTNVSIGVNRTIPLGNVYVVNDNNVANAECYIGDGTSWTSFNE